MGGRKGEKAEDEPEWRMEWWHDARLHSGQVMRKKENTGG